MKKLIPIGAVFFIMWTLTGFGNDRSSLENVFAEYNKCETKQCAIRYLDGIMLEQLNSIKETSKVEHILRASRLSTFKSESKNKGDYGALYLSNYRYISRPTIDSGIEMAYLFQKKGADWKLYHRLPANEVGADLKPLSPK